MSKVIVIGGGPAGMMAAISAADKHKVTLVEGNEKLGKKLFITGKGRCNITNAKDINDFFDFIPGNPEFLYSSLYGFTNEDTMNFFEKLGVKLKVERGDRVFPESDKSSDIIGGFASELKRKGVEILYNSKVSNVIKNEDKIIGIELENKTVIKGDYFILCTGGMSYPVTGSKGEGLIFAKQLGHNIIKTIPALVPLEVKEEWVRELQGLSLKNVEFSIVKSKKVLYKDFGEMLFTHFGLSGPIVLSGSRLVGNNQGLKAVINLKPSLSENELDERIQKDFLKYINKDFKNALDDLLPQKLINTIIRLSGIDGDKKVNSITKQERKQLVNILRNLSFEIKGTRSIAEAIVTAGGVDTTEVDPSTMKSKIITNLYFAGEVLDVDAFTGGFNIQIAMSTGYLAGISVGE
jgi:predicted Rossmann fold flavoprotein